MPEASRFPSRGMPDPVQERLYWGLLTLSNLPGTGDTSLDEERWREFCRCLHVPKRLPIPARVRLAAHLEQHAIANGDAELLALAEAIDQDTRGLAP